MKIPDNMDIEKIHNRIIDLLGLKNDGDVGILLGMKPKTYLERKRTGSIPFKEICSWASKEGYSIDYLLTGKESPGKKSTEDHTRVADRFRNKEEKKYIPKFNMVMRWREPDIKAAMLRVIDVCFAAPDTRKKKRASKKAALKKADTKKAVPDDEIG